MIPHITSLARSGLVALGVVAGLSAPALAGPGGLATLPAVPDRAETPILVQGDGRFSDCTRGGDCSPAWRGGFNEPRIINPPSVRPRPDRDGGRRYTRDWDRRDGRRYHRRHYRNYDRYHDRYYDRGPDIFFSFGIPGFGYYDPYYDPYYYRPSYRYYEPPRRVYRARGSQAHVEWCYNRYRSYRAYDNSYQPYYGPRRQCVSPYG
jgi:hypothetical protein